MLLPDVLDDHGQPLDVDTELYAFDEMLAIEEALHLYDAITHCWWCQCPTAEHVPEAPNSPCRLCSCEILVVESTWERRCAAPTCGHPLRRHGRRGCFGCHSEEDEADAVDEAAVCGCLGFAVPGSSPDVLRLLMPPRPEPFQIVAAAPIGVACAKG